MRKTIVLLVLAALAIFIYQQYGYLLQSRENRPVGEAVTDTTPVDLPANESDEDLAYLSLPPRFSISYYAKDVPGARSLALGRDGTVYVGSRPEGVVYALRDNNGDGRADTRYTVASGLDNPNGVAYKEGNLYVAEIGRVIRYRNIDESYDKSPQPDTVATLNEKTHHGWRYIGFGPDNLLYIGIGFPCNVCEDEDQYGRIIRINPDDNNEDFEVYALGVRNTVGFDWNPADNTLWFTDNGRDSLGDNVPPDELNHAPIKDLHFGFPYCHGGTIPDPQFGKGINCSDYTAPAVNLDPHVAALGVKFYTGSMFPIEYKDKALIAEHGSWNRTTPIGYRVRTVNINGRNASEYEDFIDGWLGSDGKAKGRPVDILELADGSVLVSDDLADAVYRVSYNK